MKYLVTGATGLLGNNVVRQLVANQADVRVLVRGDLPRRELNGLAVEAHRGDLVDPHSAARAVDGVQCVIHAAGDLHIGWRHWKRLRRVNVAGTAELAQAARAAGARLVHISTVDALAAAPGVHAPVDEETPDACKLPCTYVVTKREAEAAVRDEIERGLDAVIVNPGFMLGPWDWKPSSGRMLLSVAQRWIPAAPVGGMSGCDVRDVAQGVIAAAVRGVRGRRYIMAGENLSYYATWKLFARVTQSRGPVIRMGPAVRFVVGRTGDLVGRLRKMESDVNSAMVKMSSMYHYYCSDRATNELGYQTRPFETSVVDAWRWFNEFGYA